MKPFDVVNSPLEGTTLIEASAGTGKTYTIEGLFLRLILEKQLPVNQILVVTFTQAATDELKDRIRRKLVQVKKAFRRRSGSDDVINSLTPQFPRNEPSIQLLNDALIDFDQAAIFTIHGFCQRILNENSFETHKLFDTELITDQTPLVQEAVNDYWRKHVYHAPVEFAGYLVAGAINPGHLFKLTNNVKTLNVTILPEMEEPALESLSAFRDVFKDLKNAWFNARSEVIEKLKDPALNGTVYGSFRNNPNTPQWTKRDVKILSLVESMERFVSGAYAGVPLFKEMEKFTTAKIQQATRKNQSPPAHPFFELCDNASRLAASLESEMETALVYLKTKLFDEIADELQQKKQERNVLYFDDLLILVKNALHSEGGRALTEAVRRKYKAVLVDEFQDTDSIQYEIFSKLFADRDTILFFIGDPKQAIYGFRGADIFSYLKAAEEAEAKYTLTCNWRSHPGLITAVNTLFSNVESPFVFDEIAFVEGNPADPAHPGSDSDKPPFTMWYLDSREFSEEDKPIRKAAAVEIIAVAVAAEITRLLNSDSDPVKAGDIAILVRTNRQAQLIKHTLSAKNVPSVLYSTGNIFESHEAMEMEIILSSISEPSDSAKYKAALAMDIIGVKGDDLNALDRDTGGWEARLIRFREYLHAWSRYGFIRMFRLLLSNEDVKPRLLSLADGERRLTNVLHLAEILHHQSMQSNLGVAGLVKWLAEQRDPAAPRLDEHQLRLESDAAAVQIVTIHKSKGLEYPVVFCPYGWESFNTNTQEIVFHDLDHDRRLTYDLGSQADPRHIAWARKEQLAENLRLLYVALTRAKEQCYLVWGRISTAETSALAYLLYGRDASGIDEPGEFVKSIVRGKNDDNLLSDLNEIARNSKNSIRVMPLPDASADMVVPSFEIQDQLSSRKFSGNILHSWKISSYSSLISRRLQDPDQPDYDILASSSLPESGLPVETSERESEQGFDNIFSFPKGARAGIFFHDVFEHLDFISKPQVRIELVDRKLDEYGFDTNWQPAVNRMIDHVLAAPLRPDPKELQLAGVGTDDRINELEFYFPLKPVSAATLSSIFLEHGRHEISKEFPQQLDTLTFSPLSGFMKGYIDMLFLHENRYYLVDWKSNYLGPTLADYNQSRLMQTMQDNFYVLQYHIYTLALHQYLRRQKSDYDYENDFGGVFYIYIRGVDRKHGMKFGVFADIPNPALIHALGQALIPDYSYE